MDAPTLLRLASERADELPGSDVSQPFGEEWDVYKVRGKVFLLLTATTGEPTVTLKAAPIDARALREAYAEITPGYHMNKRHWITVRAGTGLDEDLVCDLVTESYLLVVENLPRAQRPVDPGTFARLGGATESSAPQ